MVAEGVFALVGVLIGAMLGFFGQWYFERGREARAARIAVSSVLYELALLSATLESAVLEKERRRKALQNDAWKQYGPNLVNYLPQYMVNALHVVHDGFEVVANAYERATKEMAPEEERAIGALLLGWAYRAERVIELLQNTGTRTSFALSNLLPWSREGWRSARSTEEVVNDIDSHARRLVEEKGYPTDYEVREA